MAIYYEEEAMSIEFEAPRGQRAHRYFWGVGLVGSNLWWNRNKRVWEPLNTSKDCCYSNIAPCRTLRSFKRMLRKHPNIKGQAQLISKYVGYDVWDVLEDGYE